MFAVCLLKEVKWDMTKTKGRNRGRMMCIFISLRVLSLSCICHSTKPVAHSYYLTESRHNTLVWDVLTSLYVFCILPTRSANYSSLWYYSFAQINMKSKSHCCGLNLQLPVILAISMIGFFWTISVFQPASSYQHDASTTTTTSTL